MTNEEKALLIARLKKISESDIYENPFRLEIYERCLEMARWKDEQFYKWHNVADGDLPESGGNYWCKLKGKYDQGSSHYKQHCNNGYCILQWLPKKKAWNVRYNTEVEAWIELPKYNEE